MCRVLGAEEVLRIAKSEMHLFRTSQSKRTFLFQVYTGLFFELNPLYESILKICDGLTDQEVVFELADEFPGEDVLKAVEVLAEAQLIYDASLKLHSDTQGPDQGICGLPESEPRESQFHITLHVSHACNVKCTYCFAHGGDYGRVPGFMTPHVARQAVRWALSEARSFGRCQIDFFGGEPLLNFELIRDIIPFAREYAHRVGVQVSFGIATNGTLISDEILQFLIDEEIHIQVSVDGNPRDQNRLRKFRDGSETYNVVAENLLKLTKESPDKVSVRATMTSYNLDRESIADDLRQLGACRVRVAPVVAAPEEPYALREEHLPEIKRRLCGLSRHETANILEGSHERGFFDRFIERLMTRAKSCYGCQGGRTFLAVDVEGDIYFCSSLADRPEFKMGDVFSGLDENVQDGFKDSFHVDSRSDCRRCWARNLCGGGCIYDARTATGDPINPNPVSCEQIRYSYELAMEMCIEIQNTDKKLLQERYNLRLVNQGDAE